MKRNATKKQVMAYLLKELGINKVIAIKAKELAYSDRRWTIYKEINCALSYNHSKEDIAYRLAWSIGMIKDFAQYQ
jgi:hypothetical protein